MADYEFDSSFGNDVSPETLGCICYDDCYSPPDYPSDRAGGHYYPEGPMWHDGPSKKRSSKKKVKSKTNVPKAKKPARQGG